MKRNVFCCAILSLSLMALGSPIPEAALRSVDTARPSMSLPLDKLDLDAVIERSKGRQEGQMSRGDL